MLWTLRFMSEFRQVLTFSSIWRYRRAQLCKTKQKEDIKHAIQVAAKYPRRATFMLRPGGSDDFVLKEILIDKVYESVTRHIDRVDNIIDIGANIGLATIVFQGYWPGAKVVCVEPASDNIELLKKNLHRQIIEGTCKLLSGAAWGHSGKVKFADLERGQMDGRQCFTDEGDRPGELVSAFTVQDIIDFSGYSFVDLLKIDIEGGEVELFRGNVDWLRKVGVVAIEFHGTSRRDSGFDKVMHDYGFTVVEGDGHTIIAKRLSGVADKRLVMITDSYEGGAAITCRRLFALLKALPEWQVYWVVAGHGRGANIQSAGEWPALIPWLVMRLVFRFSSSARLRSRALKYVSEISVARCVRVLKPDVIMLHNIHGATTVDLLDHLPRSVPLVWRLADMWPLTGYCCYSFDCRDYLTGCCRNCDVTTQEGPRWRSPKVEWQRSERFFRGNQHRLAFVAPSRWMCDCAKARLPGFRIETITNPVGLEIFKPVRPKSTARSVLGLPQNVPVILVGAALLDNPTKGVRYLVDALEILCGTDNDRIKVVAFGDRNGSTPFPGGWEMIGAISDERLLNLYYNAADVYVSPALAETFGLTLAEAVAAGTPAVVFNVGGCVDTVIDGVTGYVAQYKDSQSLALCIRKILDMDEHSREEMSRRCRKFSEERYLTTPTVEQRYAALLEDMIKKMRP